MITFAFGPIRGRLNEFVELLELCHEFIEGEDYRLVIPGNFIGYGPDSANVIATLIAFQVAQPGKVIVLRGRAEALMCAVDSNYTLARWIALGGGGPILQNYFPALPDPIDASIMAQIPAEHLEFLRQLPESFDDGQRCFISEDAAHPTTGNQGQLSIYRDAKSDAHDTPQAVYSFNLNAEAGAEDPLTMTVFDDRKREPVAILHSGTNTELH